MEGAEPDVGVLDPKRQRRALDEEEAIPQTVTAAILTPPVSWVRSLVHTTTMVLSWARPF